MPEPEIMLREATREDEPFLWEALYHALYTPPGRPAPDRAIVRLPEIARYVAGWGREGDLGVVASEVGQPVGAAWLRVWRGKDKGYGYIDDDTPELSIAMLPAWRGQGIGSRLMAALLGRARGKFAGVSLSVTISNPAARLYERHGFVIVSRSGGAATMLLRL